MFLKRFLKLPYSVRLASMELIMLPCIVRTSATPNGSFRFGRPKSAQKLGLNNEIFFGKMLKM